jgi:hypothetical protein
MGHNKARHCFNHFQIHHARPQATLSSVSTSLQICFSPVYSIPPRRLLTEKYHKVQAGAAMIMLYERSTQTSSISDPRPAPITRGITIPASISVYMVVSAHQSKKYKSCSTSLSRGWISSEAKDIIAIDRCQICLAILACVSTNFRVRTYALRAVG